MRKFLENMKTKTQIYRAARRLYKLCLVHGSLDDDLALQIVQRITNSKRRRSLTLLSYFRRLVTLNQEAHTANIEAAVPLSNDLMVLIQTRLKDRYGPELDTRFAVEPSLIGGMRIKVGSDVYDGSVQSRLKLLEQGL